MSEYIAAEKGKLISSSSNNRKKKKKKHREIGAGCGGVFFQIFHGKRLFSWKSLPEGMLHTGMHAYNRAVIHRHTHTTMHAHISSH
jgi:hypothetical protein